MKVENGDAVVYDFDWYPAKAQSNLRKHGVSFRLATTVFRDPLAITLYDEDHSDDEDRWVTLGYAETGILIVYRPDAVFRLPVYLDEQVQSYLVAKADAKGVELSDLVNDLLRREIEMIETVG